MEYIMISTTCKDKKEAREIAKELLQLRLAACVQMESIESLYMWKNSMCEDPEVRLLIKTKMRHFARIQNLIEEIHSYELPQVIYTQIEGSREYLKWIDAEVK